MESTIMKKQLITDQEIIHQFNSGAGKKTEFKVVNQGDGAIAIRYVKKGVDLYFKYKGEKNYQYIKIGRHCIDGINGITINKAMSIASTAANIKRDGGDFQKYLMDVTGREPLINKSKTKNKQGSFGQLLLDYVELHLQGKRSYGSAKSSLNRHVHQVKEFNYMVKMPANEIRAEHIVEIIARLIHEEKLGGSCNRIRNMLSAAFSWGIKYDHNPRFFTGDRRRVKYNLAFNPVQNIPVQPDLEGVGKEQLTDRQIWEVWHHAPIVMGKVGILAKLLLAMGGVRQEQLALTPWEKFKLDGSYPHVLIKNDKAGGIEYIVPLNNLALDIIKHLKNLYGHCQYPFPGGVIGYEKMDAPMTLGNFSKPCNRFHKHLQEVVKSPSPRMTVGMIRGTVSTRMNEAGVEKAVKEMIAGHHMTDVTTKHYDRWAYKQKKKEAVDKWAAYLQTIITLPYEEVTDRMPEEDG